MGADHRAAQSCSEALRLIGDAKAPALETLPQADWTARFPSRVDQLENHIGLAAAIAAGGRRATLGRVRHDPFYGSGAAAALSAASQADIDFSGASRRSHVDYAAHVVVGDHVARTDDHGQTKSRFVQVRNCREQAFIPRSPQPRTCNADDTRGSAAGRAAEAARPGANIELVLIIW